ncbi:DUF6585 family protein [Lignipirellula cremea]|uniref:Uncharacterized protein n=1 Tax=Lignipirellula cremea TaxID=2528010 RepID=A0A518DVU4_9BACT|nr:DUF6585 family protein [Lignipirellula cremea]QDU95960.1 hypothetical protein Pla8534_37790 [Lignipirellula cremea]
MADNPYRSPAEAPTPRLAARRSEKLGNLLAEYRVHPVVIWSSLALAGCAIGICCNGILELFTTNTDHMAEMLAIVSGISLIAILVAASALRSRMSVYDRGIVYANAFRSFTFRYTELADLRVSSNALAPLGKVWNPLQRHLVLSIDSPVQKRYYLCPFLLSDVGLLELAVNTWEKASRNPIAAPGSEPAPGRSSRE